MSLSAFDAGKRARSSWFQLWLPIGKPRAAIERHVPGWRSTARPTGKNVAGASLASRIATILRRSVRFQPSSNVSATSFAVRAPWFQIANRSAAVTGPSGMTAGRSGAGDGRVGGVLLVGDGCPPRPANGEAPGPPDE